MEKAGWDVLGVDVFPDYVAKLNDKSFVSPEPFVTEFLQKSSKFRATTDFDEAVAFSNLIMVLVDTPSGGGDRHYDHSKLARVLTEINKRKVADKHLVICCTVIPGWIAGVGRFLIRDCPNTTLSYNPEFIAQGDVIRGLLKPDMVLIGEGSKEAGDILERLYVEHCENKPQVHRMAPESAEICKLSINCFVTTKISFANMIGDIADKTPGANKHDILDAVGADSRVGKKYLRPGYGFGGPCFPRDNRALGGYASSVGIDPKLPRATDEYNKMHTQIQVQELLDSGKQEFVFSDVAYKENCTVPIIEESQKLVIASSLVKAGRKVTIKDKQFIVNAVMSEFGSMFTYELL
eukprot:JP446218.1.p1 GENE.JP446218.1~~JP446218.1.p1  ORF type:complete len:387 (-),score=121.56 JP446218.1:225-1274(-)